MTYKEIIEAIIIGIITGLISGGLSALLVTKFYRKKDKKNQINRTFRNGLYTYYEYLRDMKNELDTLIKPLPNQEFIELKRMLSSYRSLFDNADITSKLDDDAEPLLHEIDDTLIQLQNELEEGNVNLVKARSNLAKQANNILKAIQKQT